MKIDSRSGDLGETRLLGGACVSKASPRIDAHGDVDELNSWLGLCRTVPFDARVDALFERVQAELLDLGAELLARPGDSIPQGNAAAQLVGKDATRRIERALDDAETELEPLTSCIVPGGSPAAAHLHVARTVCRRAERKVVALAATDAVRPEVIAYLNRLADLLFVLARLANQRARIRDVPWNGPVKVGARGRGY